MSEVFKPAQEVTPEWLAGQYEAEVARYIAENTRLRQLASRDTLTGALNRRGMEDEFEKLHNSLERNGHLPVSVAVIDLDHFKAVNDSLGHARGDAVLECFADTVRAMIREDKPDRPGDIFGRLGGDEFALVLVDARPDQALAFSERLRAAIAEDADSQFNGVTLSIGLVTADRQAELAKVIELADGALYQAKEQGRNGVVMLNAPASGTQTL